MLSRRPSPEHQEAVSRRLALLSAELAGVREGGPEPPGSVEHAEPVEPVEPPMTHTRVRPPSPPSPPPRDFDDVEPPPVPQPGRHASRRPTRGLVPDTWRGRWLLGPAQLALVAVMVVVGLAVTGWWLVRSQARTVAAPEPPVAVSGLATPAQARADPSASSPSASATSATGATVTVDVTGKVRRPGIVVLDAGARVVDALEAAGGARPRVDTGSLNLARVLVDGEQIVVGVPAPGLAGVPVPMPSSSPGGLLVNLNTATQTELESLPEVGPVTAQAILTWRTEHGAFTSVDELLEVDGIGDATLATIAPHVTV